MAPLTPLVRPDLFFAERDLDGFRILVVVGGVGISLLVLWYVSGWIMTDRIDGTVEVDNPDRPPDAFCDNDIDLGETDDCNQPRKIEKNVDAVLWDVWGTVAGQLLLVLPIVWSFLAALLHVGSRLAGGENGVVATFGVAAWGLVPSLAGGIVAVVVLYFVFDPITVTPANQNTALETAKHSFRALDANLWVLGLVTSAWTAVIWRYGLEYRQGISAVAAWSVAGSVAAILFVIGLG